MPSNKALKSSRQHAFLAQSGRCHYCQGPTWLNHPSELSLEGLPPSVQRLLRCTAEHAVSRKDGGGNGLDNTRAACFWCNNRRHRRKGGLSEGEYLHDVRLRVAQGRWWPSPIAAVLRSPPDSGR